MAQDQVAEAASSPPISRYRTSNRSICSGSRVSVTQSRGVTRCHGGRHTEKINNPRDGDCLPAVKVISARSPSCRWPASQSQAGTSVTWPPWTNQRRALLCSLLAFLAIISRPEWAVTTVTRGGWTKQILAEWVKYFLSSYNIFIFT